MITAQDIINKLENSIQNCGEDEYQKHGACGVMDVSHISDKLQKMDPVQVAGMLESLYAKERYQRLVSDLAWDFIGNEDDSWFERFYNNFKFSSAVLW